jgi:cytochrome c oxidase subunit 2
VKRICTVAALLLLAACATDENALRVAGPQAHRIGQLFSAFLWITGAVYVLVMAALIFALVRRRREPLDPMNPDPAREHRMRAVIGGAVAVTAVILLGFVTASTRTGRALNSLGDQAKDPLTIEVIGHQWWWEFHYLNPVASQIVFTANELHIPTGQPVRLKITARDVIHSFWIPELHGKKDAIPGWENTDYIQADRPGLYRGQCAEFCGHQHAHMGLNVFADEPRDFDKWIAGQRGPAHQPATPEEKRGHDVFLRSACTMCHQITGTTAHALAGPDLTHLASRQTLAAGTLPNTPGNLAGWILNPQTVKPGAHMPPNDLRGSDLQDLLAYLGSLK